MVEVSTRAPSTPDHEYVILGAGVSGLYQLHRLRELGLDAIALEANGGVGGTWFQNRYPGCRFDSESYTYGYSFSDELLQEWNWSEMFAAQPETLRYLHRVAEKFDLLPHIRFNSQVTAARFNDATELWSLTVADGPALTCRHLITAVGNLTVPTVPDIPGRNTFAGQIFHTRDWPHEGVALEGKRVGVVGTGATGIQVISSIAADVGSLTVFQRRPNWAAPLNNRAISDQEMADIKARYHEIFRRCDATPGGFIHGPLDTPFDEATPERRRALWEELYGMPGFGIWLGNYREVLMDDEANAELSAFMADKIRGRVNDPDTAEKLIPTDHGFGVQRVPLETGYYEAYNRHNVDLVDLNDTPIEAITATGVRLTGGRAVPLDVLVFATGFDAITGAFDRIEISGREGVSLKDKWAASPQTAFGIQVPDFPNFYMLTGPLSASASTNFPRAIDACVKWVTDLFSFMIEHGYTTVVPTQELADEWVETVARSYRRLLLRRAKTWFTGYNSNIEGRDHTRYLMYMGGAPRYRRFLAAAADNDYEGFMFSTTEGVHQARAVAAL